MDWRDEATDILCRAKGVIGDAMYLPCVRAAILQGSGLNST